MERSNLARLVTWVVYPGQPAAIKLNLNQSRSVAPHWNKCYATWSKSGPPWSTPLPLASTLEWPAWALSSVCWTLLPPCGGPNYDSFSEEVGGVWGRKGNFKGFFGERGYTWLGYSFYATLWGLTYIATSFYCVSPSTVLLLLVLIWLLLLKLVSIEGHTAKLWGMKRANICAWNFFK